jgi:hypothetical protein
MPTSSTDELHYDPEAAENGWNATADLRSEVGPSTLPALNLTDVSVLGLRVSRELMKPEVRAPFEKLATINLFDVSLLDRIEPASWAVWYGDTRIDTLTMTVGRGKLRVETVDKATAIRGRMLRVGEYMLSTNAKASRELADIRSGHGYADLAKDLVRLASLYQTYAEVVSKGGAHYDAADVDTAKAISGEILYELGDSEEKELSNMKDETARAFVVLESAYETVRRWAGAIWDDPDYFPSLYSTRDTPTHKKNGAATTSGADTTSQGTDATSR